MDTDEDLQARPKFTKTPNTLLDELMPLMKEAELRVTLALMRQTIGFHRERVSLSIADFQGLTGLSRQGVINGIEQGIQRTTVVREEDGRGGFFYGLVLVEQASQLSRLVNLVDYHSGSVLVNLVDQYTPVLKKKEIGKVVSSLSSTDKRKKTNSLPKPTADGEGESLEPMQQLALDLLVDSEVGIFGWLAELLVRKLPAQDIYRAVDQWLPASRKGKIGPGLLATQLDELVPSGAPTVTLSANFRDSELFHRHRLPDELVADGRKRYSELPEQEPRKKYSV